MEIFINYIDDEKLINSSTVEFGFSIISDKQERLTFKAYDPLFNIKYIPGDHTIDAVPSVNYWVRFEIDLRANEEKPNTRFGFILTCEDEEGNVILEKTYPTNRKANNLRPEGEEKVLWIIGDSNVWASFGNDDFRYQEIAGYKPVRISITSLSLNRFINGKNLDLMLGLPIRENDCIAFYLGEIDFRYTIHKYTEDKCKDLSSACLDLMSRYLESLMNIRKYFRDNRIIVMSPNPPFPKDYHYEENMVRGSEDDRILCFDIFNEFWSSQGEFEYLNWTNEYTDPNGLMKVEDLYEGNHHIKEHTKISKRLSTKIINKNMETKMDTIESVSPKELVDYCLEHDLMEKCIFMQVYEEILTLAYWLKGFQPVNVLEIGTMGSTFWLINKLSTGKKVSVDIDPRQSIIHHFMYGEDWRFFQGDSHTEEMYNNVKDFCPQFDFIFIDGDHTYNGVKRDFEMYKNLLSPRGVIAFHDIDPDHIFADSYAGQVYKFWQDLEEGTKTNIVCKKSSGNVKLNGVHSQGFGGIGIWRP
jgi:predicted O-methyltransferase YrrM